MTRDLRAVGVVGAGTMGAGIAQVAASQGHDVVLVDVSERKLQAGLRKLSKFLRRGAEKGRYSARCAEAAIARVTTTCDLAALAGCDIVIEAVVEDLEEKRDLFRQLESLVAADAILATNTSTLSVSGIASALERPQRACGMHFFNPAPVMRLVEIIPAPATDPEVLDTVMALAAFWGKTPIRAADTPGFIVNRVARPYYLEGLRLLGDRIADVATIDRLAREGGFPRGPFELMDLIGLDVNLAAAESVYKGLFGEPRLRPHPIQRAMVEGGHLGRKTGQGYYSYQTAASDPPGRSSSGPPAAPDEAASGGARTREWATGRVVVVGDKCGGLAEPIAERLRLRGAEVVAAGGPLGESSLLAGLQSGAYVGVDACVVDRDRKARLLAMFDAALPERATILTCCHAASATAAAAPLDHPERVVGFALLAPWRGRSTVECARAVQTADECVAAAQSFWATLGFEPVWVADSPGLVLPRIVACLANEAAFALQEGAATAADIDQAMELGTGYPRGPLAWAELIGLEHVVAILDALAMELGAERYRAAPVLRRLVAAGRSTFGRDPNGVGKYPPHTPPCPSSRPSV